MPLQENLNVAPYYADYTPLSDYYSILFKAGYPVQARELTNMQLMLQNQIESFMSRFLKIGDTIIPGEYAYATADYVRVSSITQGSTPSDFLGSTLTGVVSGVKATVQFYADKTADDDVTFYVIYENSGTTSEYKTFIEGETLESNTENRYTAVTGVSGVSMPLKTVILGELVDSPAMGKGSLFVVEPGSYYVDGISVRNDKQTITLDKYSTKPTYDVGFNVSEQYITSNDDPALLDNSQGSSNFAAPGADRLKIRLVLAKTIASDSNTNFIRLATIVQGNIIREPQKEQNWQWLYDILAQRTYDESGDYIITEFPIETLQYWNSAEVNGLFNADEDDLYPPVPKTGTTELLSFSEADENYVVKVSQGEAYVQGFNVGFSRPIYVFGKKPRTQSFRANSTTTIRTPFEIKITDVYNLPDVANITGDVNTVAFDGITLYRNFNDGYVGESVQSDGNPVNIGQAPVTTYHVMASGDIGTINETGINKVVYQGTTGAVVEMSGSSVVARYNGTAQTGSVVNTIGGAPVTIATEITPAPAGVLYPRYIMPDSIVDDLIYEGDSSQQMAVAGYNSTYDMGIVKSEFFTEFPIIKDTGTTLDTTAWVVGDLVYGERTRTFGTVEAGSTVDILILSNIVGEFEAGEFVTQVVSGGTKIGRIAKANDVIGFDFPLISQLNNLSGVTSLTVSAVGSSITLSSSDFEYLSATNELIPTISGRAKLRNFPYQEGSQLQKTRVNLTVVANAGSSKETGYATRIRSKGINSLSKTKSFFSALADTTNFTANMAIEDSTDTDIISLANGSLFSGVVNDNKIVCNNFNGNPAEELVFGDLITFTDDTGLQQSHLVAFTTEPVGYGPNRSKSAIYLTTPLQNAVTSSVVDRIRIMTEGEPQHSLLFQLPQRTVASLQSDITKTAINYYVLQEFIVSATAGATSIILETNKSNEFFIQGSPNVIASIVETNVVGNLEVGRQLTVFSSTTSDSNRKVTLNISEGTTPIRRDCQVKIIIPVYVTNALAKSKKLTSLVSLNVSAADAAKPVISLGVADALMVDKVIIDSSQVDIRDNYTFDNGQRDNFYGISTLTLNPGAPVPSGSLTITYTYFEHSGAGDFFSVDSYTSDGGIEYAAIPVYAPIASSPIDVKSNEIYIRLRDCVDFRPVVNTTGSTPSYIPTISPGKPSVGSTNFRNTSNDGNGTSPRIPLVNSNFECNIAFYQPKIDSLFIEKTGALTLVEGVPADEPVAPPDLATGIRLYNIKLPPYVFDVEDIDVTKFNYKGYRMKDIVSLERRIGRLEELVSLSLLEQSALNMNVRDAVTGLDRFKNGIVVDPFSTHQYGDTANEGYHCSIDEASTHLRAPFYADQVELIEQVQTNLQRGSLGYRKAGPQLMLDYQIGPYISNPVATQTINLQPYSVFTYLGDVDLVPGIDTWQDITTRPDLVIRDTSIYDAMLNMTDTLAEVGLGTVWTDWESVGETQTSVSTNTTRTGSQIITVTNETQSSQRSRTQLQTNLNVQTGRVVESSYGERITDVQLARTMRSRSVQIYGTRLKPNTRYYIFFDDVDCTEWFAIDNISTAFPDGTTRYEGNAGTNNRGFGYPVLSDDVGDLQGVFIIPNGRPPVQQQVFTNFANVSYQTSGPTRSFNTGTRKFRITTSKTNEKDGSQLEGVAESNYTASGVLLDKQDTIVATNIPTFSLSNDPFGGAETEIVTDVVVTEISRSVINLPPPVPSPPPRPPRPPRPAPQPPQDEDPVAQTFYIDGEDYPEGVFVTDLMVYFNTKDPVEGVEAYLTTTDGDRPTPTIVPYSRVTKNSDTVLRVKCTLGAGISSTTIPAGTIMVGANTSTIGVLKSAMTFNASSQSSTTNVTNTTYNMVLSNYNGEFFAGEEIVPSVTPANASTFTIVDREVDITYAEVTDVGSGYSSNATVAFSAPSLPGGVTATGTVKVGAPGSSGAGMVYGIDITNYGSGYVQPPSATISDTTGSGALVNVRTVEGKESIDMGVATSDDATAGTKFSFPTPIYLLGGSSYAFVLRAPTSIKYNVFISTLGQNILGTQNRVTSQPSLGSLFKSQNGGLWTEDQNSDIKFDLRRSVFYANTIGRINLINGPVENRPTELNPITTNSAVLTEAGATRFGSNPKIVRFECKWHGLLAGDLVAIEGVTGDTAGKIGGIPIAEFNTLHTVVDSDMNTFTIEVSTASTDSFKGGGSNVRLSVNKEYECINVTTGAMVFGPTSISTRTTPTIGLSSSQLLRANTLTDTESLDMGRRRYTREKTHVIDLLKTYYYSEAKTVINEINEAKYTSSDRLNKKKSLTVEIDILSRSDAVSPVINIERTNATVIRNLIDYPEPTDPIFGVPVATLVTNGDSSGLTNVTAGSTLSFTNHMSQAKTVYVDSHDTATNRIKVRGEAVSDLARNPTYSDSALQALGVASVVTEDGSLYYPEVNNRGSAFAKYISKLFIFENECDGIQLKLTACYYRRDSIRCYYRPRTVGFDGDISQVNWIPFNPTQELSVTQVDPDQQNILVDSKQVVPGLPDDVRQIVVRDSDNVNPDDIGPSAWRSLNWTAQDIPKFDAIAVKVVMTADNPALTPIIDDLQLVVSE